MTGPGTKASWKVVAGGLVPIFIGHWARGGVHPGQVVSPSQGNTESHRTDNLPLKSDGKSCWLPSSPCKPPSANESNAVHAAQVSRITTQTQDSNQGQLHRGVKPVYMGRKLYCCATLCTQ
ncbi:hypothetical protein ILYODFUR_004295 [Ilyodon furcidens]|uniref:Uncharacterized protein n=1 Tax=Ilyodon furcidens TaxID=33524 RepID=A0ABV0SJ99_9TELE